jgi:hypothetical protein
MLGFYAVPGPPSSNSLVASLLTMFFILHRNNYHVCHYVTGSFSKSLENTHNFKFCITMKYNKIWI